HSMCHSLSLHDALPISLIVCLCPSAHAAQCGSSAAGYEGWKQQFAGEARAKGISANAISALMATNYAQTTINADRGQRSFNLSLDRKSTRLELQSRENL